MEHPLAPKIEGLSLEEIQRKISDLYKRLAFAQRSGNPFVADQIRMLLETYNGAYQRELDRVMPKSDDDDDEFGKLVDIS